jgi:site-specific recombinase XerD
MRNETNPQHQELLNRPSSGKIKTVEQGLAFFETVGMPARDLAARTRQEYTNDLTDLIKFLTKRGVTRLKQVSLQDLENYQAEMDRRGYQASTRERKSYAIKSFFRFLHHHGMIANNVASRLIPPRPKKPEPRFLSEDEYHRLLRACSHSPRDAAIVEVLLQTGIRLSELARLTIYDVEIPKRINREPDNTGTVRVRRKGGKVDTIPLNYKACQALAAWLKVRPELDHSTLLVTKFNTPMSKRAIQYTVSKYLHAADIKNASVHTLRHTFGTHHALRGTDLKTIQETLGHADLSTTAIYVSLAKNAQRKALQQNAL